MTQAAPWAEAYKTAYTGLEDKTISTLSGDVFSPSQHSRFNRGGLFETLFNVMKIDVAGPGDHEFDFGVERFLELQRDYSFDWVLSNLIHVPKKNPVTEPETGKLLQKIKKHKIVEKNGFKIGFFGLFDKKTFLKSRLARTDLEIEDPIQTAVKVSKQLRDEKCDLVVLLSHMDSESDIEVLNAAGNEIDLAFGGHNRKFRVQLVNNRLLLKSGHNFIDFSKSKIWFSKTQVTQPTTTGATYKWIADTDTATLALKNFNFALKKADAVYLNIEIQRIVVDKNGKKDKTVQDYYQNAIGIKYLHLDQWAAFSINAKQDLADYPNNPYDLPVYRFIADSLRASEGIDVAIIPFRDFGFQKPIENNVLKSKLDLSGLIPIDDELVVLNVPGAQFGNLVKEWLSIPKKNPVMVGLSFTYNVAGNVKTLDKSTQIQLNGEPINDKKTYTLITTRYYTQGTELPTLKNCLTGEHAIEGFFAIDIVMAEMGLAQDDTFTRELDCWRSVFPQVTSGEIFRILSPAEDEDLDDNFCRVQNELSKTPNKPLSAYMALLRRSSQIRMAIYTNLEKSVNANAKTTYFVVDAKKLVSPIKAKRILI